MKKNKSKDTKTEPVLYIVQPETGKISAKMQERFVIKPNRDVSVKKELEPMDEIDVQGEEQVVTAAAREDIAMIDRKTEKMEYASEETLPEQAEEMEYVSGEALLKQAEEMESVGEEALLKQAEEMESVGEEALPEQAEEMESVGGEALPEQAEEMESVGEEALLKQAEEMESVGEEALPEQAEEMESVGGEALPEQAEEMESVGEGALLKQAEEMESVGEGALLKQAEEMESVGEEVTKAKKAAEALPVIEKKQAPQRWGRKPFRDMTIEEKISFLVHRPSYIPNIRCRLKTVDDVYIGYIEAFKNNVITIKSAQALEIIHVSIEEIKSIHMIGM